MIVRQKEWQNKCIDKINCASISAASILNADFICMCVCVRARACTQQIKEKNAYFHFTLLNLRNVLTKNHVNLFISLSRFVFASYAYDAFNNDKIISNIKGRSLFQSFMLQVPWQGECKSSFQV